MAPKWFIALHDCRINPKISSYTAYSVAKYPKSADITDRPADITKTQIYPALLLDKRPIYSHFAALSSV